MIEQGGERKKEGIKPTLNGRLSVEGVHAPPIEMEFYMHRHESKGDALAIKPLIKDADIVFIEISGHAAELETYLNSLSIAPKDTIAQIRKNFAKRGGANSYEAGLAEALYKSGVVVISPDLQAGDPLYDEYKAMIERKVDWIHDQFFPKDGEKVPFDQALQIYERFTNENVAVTQKREERVEENIFSGIRDNLKQRPDLQTKSKLKIVAVLGASHTSIPASFSRKYPGTRVSMTFPEPRVQFTHNVANERAFIRGLTPSTEDLEKGLTDIIVGYWMLKQAETLPAYLRLSFHRLTIDVLTPGERRELYDLFLEDPDKSGSRFKEILTARGIPSAISPKRLEKLVTAYRDQGTHPEVQK
jgi:hypothetical protein